MLPCRWNLDCNICSEINTSVRSIVADRSIVCVAAFGRNRVPLVQARSSCCHFHIGVIATHLFSRSGFAVVLCSRRCPERCQLNCLILKQLERLRVDAMTKLSIVLKQDEARKPGQSFLGGCHCHTNLTIRNNCCHCPGRQDS